MSSDPPNHLTRDRYLANLSSTHLSPTRLSAARSSVRGGSWSGERLSAVHDKSGISRDCVRGSYVLAKIWRIVSEIIMANGIVSGWIFFQGSFIIDLSVCSSFLGVFGFVVTRNPTLVPEIMLL